MATINVKLNQRFPFAADPTSPAPPSIIQGVLKHGYIPPPPTQYYNAVTEGGCHNNGSDDDLAHLTAAADAAKAAGKALYCPAGTGYKLSGAFSPPTDLTIFGDGVTSKLQGWCRWRSGQTWKDLFIGSKTTKAISQYYATGVWTAQDVLFEGCKFRGGGSGNSTLAMPTGSSTSTYHIDRDITFKDCEWECNYITGYAPSAQDVSWFIRREFGDICDNIVFEHCHFGTENEQGRSGGAYGGIVFWSSWPKDGYPDTGDKEKGYQDNIYFTRCVWEQADIWNLDMSGYGYDGSTPSGVLDDYTENTCFITDCAFKGLSGLRRPEYPTRVTAQCEPGRDCVISRNIFGIGDSNAWKFVKGCRRCTFTDNVFDYCTYKNNTDSVSGGPIIDHLYDEHQIVMIGGAEGSLTVTGNKLLLPTGKYTSIGQSGWISDAYGRATKSNNSVEWRSGTGPLAGY